MSTDLAAVLNAGIERLASGEALTRVEEASPAEVQPYLRLFAELLEVSGEEARPEFRMGLRARLLGEAVPETRRAGGRGWTARAASIAAATFLVGSAVNPALAESLVRSVRDTIGAEIAHVVEQVFREAPGPLAHSAGQTGGEPQTPVDAAGDAQEHVRGLLALDETGDTDGTEAADLTAVVILGPAAGRPPAIPEPPAGALAPAQPAPGPLPEPQPGNEEAITGAEPGPVPPAPGANPNGAGSSSAPQPNGGPPGQTGERPQDVTAGGSGEHPNGGPPGQSGKDAEGDPPGQSGEHPNGAPPGQSGEHPKGGSAGQDMEHPQGSPPGQGSQTGTGGTGVEPAPSVANRTEGPGPAVGSPGLPAAAKGGAAAASEPQGKPEGTPAKDAPGNVPGAGKAGVAAGSHEGGFPGTAAGQGKGKAGG